MAKKPQIWILVPDGTGIKNYLYSRVFKNPEIAITLLHNFDTETLSLLKKEVHFENDIVLPNYKESIKEKFLRELIHLSRLKYYANIENNATILNAWNRNHKSVKLKLFYFLVVFVSNFISNYNTIVKLETKYDKRIKKNPFYHKIAKILQQGNPHHLFCTHQRALKAPTVFAVARDMNIPTTTVIYSWDNLPKARLALRADQYLVWSKYMKDELIKFYPEIPKLQIKVTGTPQFEFYYDPKNIIPKQVFYNKYHLDETKKLICFSGDDTRTSPYDPEYLNDIASAIVESGKENEVTILFRRCPVDTSGRYDWVLEKFSNLIKEAPPLWNFNSDKWTAVYPTSDDIKLLVSTAYYCDVVVNVGSTMAFDFGMFQKPCIFINYDVKKDSNWSVDTIYRFQHFKSMPSKKAVYWFNSNEEIIIVLEKALKHPFTDINTWFNIVVEYSKEASVRILNKLI